MGEPNPPPHVTTVPKYARMEYERRFLVDPTFDCRLNTQPYCKLLEDRYLDCGRLRVRRLEDSDTGRVTFKLTKKFESDPMFAQPVVSVWLSPSEYEALKSLPGRDLSKRRYYDESPGLVFSIDVFQGELDGLILCEIESESLDALRAARFPQYARWEVTEDRFFTGGSLCRANRLQVEAAIRLIDAPAGAFVDIVSA
jgi:CYTH domain-containing protein